MTPINLRGLVLPLTLCFGTSALADATVNFSGTLIEAPPCVVHNNNVITVNFGNEVMTTRIDGTQYRKLIDFDLDCSMAVSSKQKVRITGTAASFDSTALAGGQSGLGIALCAMEAFGRAFPIILTSAVRAGEKIGEVPKSLEKMAV
ncbi:MAG: hypothetical protein EOM46_19130, partial [Gammaproteobacteria bacterium]|nr:hypothetical protein [Gammaproteobacteria bacterium]